MTHLMSDDYDNWERSPFFWAFALTSLNWCVVASSLLGWCYFGLPGCCIHCRLNSRILITIALRLWWVWYSIIFLMAMWKPVDSGSFVGVISPTSGKCVPLF